MQPLQRVTTSALLYTLAAIATLVLLGDYARMLNLCGKMPPGPFPLPIVGNTLMLRDVKPWFYFEELSKKYNAPLITFWIWLCLGIWGIEIGIL